MKTSDKVLRLVLKLIFSISLITILGLTTAQCSKKNTDVDKITINQIPKKPLVFPSNTIVNEEDVLGAYFAFKVQVVNNSDRELTVQSMRVYVTAPTTSGPVLAQGVNADPSDLNHTITYIISSELSLDCVYEYNNFATILPHRVGYLSVFDANPDGDQTVCDPESKTPDQLEDSDSGIKFYFGGYPKKYDVPAATNYSFKVKVELVGWFGDTDDTPEQDQQVDRFEKEFSFSTE